MLGVAIIGLAGVLVAGFSALAQTNIKRVLAYSTMSQLGYMFLALGVGAWSGAIFHLVTHAFFKSLLFLAAGVVILAMNHEHDIFAMGGLAQEDPLYLLDFPHRRACACGHPADHGGLRQQGAHSLPRAGSQARADASSGFLGSLGVFVTSVYMFRLLFTVFGGQPRGAAAHGHGAAHGGADSAHGVQGPGKEGLAAGKDGLRAGVTMGIPLAILAALCVVGGFLDLPRTLGGSPFITRFLETALPAGKATAVPLSTDSILQLISEIVSLLGIPVGWLVSRARSARSRKPAPPRPGPRRFDFLPEGWASTGCMTAPSFARSSGCGS